MFGVHSEEALISVTPEFNIFNIYKKNCELS